MVEIADHTQAVGPDRHGGVPAYVTRIDRREIRASTVEVGTMRRLQDTVCRVVIADKAQAVRSDRHRRGPTRALDRGGSHVAASYVGAVRYVQIRCGYVVVSENA